MQAFIADAVHDFINGGLSLRDRLEAGETLERDRERSTFLLQLAVLDADAEMDAGLVFSEQGSFVDLGAMTRSTIRYALTCWLDEWLMHYSPAGSAWGERTLEAELFDNHDAGAEFWDEARYAETRGDLEALEVMHLCVMLGFRGRWRDKPEQLDAWATRIRVKLEQAAHPWAMPACLEPPAETLTGADDFPLRRMAFSMLLTFSLLLPFAAVLVWRR